MTGVLLVEIAWYYTYAGLFVAAVFLVVGIGRVMPDARGSYAFRPLLLPGIVLLWPAVLWRWLALERGARHGMGAYRPPRRLQHAAAVVLAIFVPLILTVSLLVRQDGPLERAPEQIAPPTATATAAPTDAAADPPATDAAPSAVAEPPDGAEPPAVAAPSADGGGEADGEAEPAKEGTEGGAQ